MKTLRPIEQRIERILRKAERDMCPNNPHCAKGDSAFPKGLPFEDWCYACQLARKIRTALRPTHPKADR